MAAEAQDCSYVYEYRNPETGRVMFIGQSKGWGAWQHLHDALKGSTPKSGFVALYRWLRLALDSGVDAKALAPHVVACLNDKAAIGGEFTRRLTAYGLENLLNSGAHDVPGADRLPDAKCSICSSDCLYRRESDLNITRAQRQVGHFGRCIPDERVGANWRDYPILNSDSFNALTLKRAQMAYSPEVDGDSFEQFCITLAAQEISTKLSGKDPSVKEAQLLAGFIRHVTDNCFFIVETTARGDLLDIHSVTLPLGKFAFAEKVFRDAGKTLRTASKADRIKLWLALRDGSAAREFDEHIDAYAALVVGGKIDYTPFDPTTKPKPAPPPPIARPADPSEYNPALMEALTRMTNGFKRRQDDTFVPPPLAAKPDLDEPDLIHALARFEALITPNPVILQTMRKPNIDVTDRLLRKREYD